MPMREAGLHVQLERVLLLKRVPVFTLLRTDQLARVAPLLDIAGWTAGTRVFDKGDPGGEMYIIVTGRVGISLHDDPAAKDFVAELGDGEYFGEMGILDDLPRSATAHVLAYTEALALGREKLIGLLTAYPELGIGMLRALSRRLREANAGLVARKSRGRREDAV